METRLSILADFNFSQLAVHIDGDINSPICFLLLHGAGSSSATWHNQINMLGRIAMIISPDLRCHGESFDDYSDMTLSTLMTDLRYTLTHVDVAQKIAGKSIIVIGHSLGGAIGTALCRQSLPELLLAGIQIVAVIVIDLVGGTALECIPLMETAMDSWPKKFANVDQCVAWSTRAGRPFSRASARVSVPSLLVPQGSLSQENITHSTCTDLTNEQSSSDWVWRTDMSRTKIYWQNWFSDFDESFLSLSIPHLLILSHRDLLDTQMTTAHMQGKLELSLISCPGAGHFIHEDFPDELVAILLRFLRTKGFIDGTKEAHALTSCLRSGYRRHLADGCA